MNVILAIPLEARLIALFVVGACLGAAVNRWLDQLREQYQPISPWSPLASAGSKKEKGGRAPATAKRSWQDRVPIVGWLQRSGESPVLGRGFWVRPMLVEILAGALVAVLYAWEVEKLGLQPVVRGVLHNPSPLHVHLQYAAHVVLIGLMLAASLIDLDETIIPDQITVPGTLAGLALAAAYPWSLLPAVTGMPPVADFLHASTPRSWPPWLEGFPGAASLAVGLVCFVAWCLALNPRLLIYPWKGFKSGGKPGATSAGRLRRLFFRDVWVRIGAAGVVGIAIGWWLGGDHWRGLLSVLIGMAVGGATVWVVRIIGHLMLGKEAMGFGDVTLMAMIGAFVGWQPVLFVFFIAPFCGVVVGVFQLVLRGSRAIPYGPFLCLAALVVIVRWASIWKSFAGVFSLGGLVPGVLIACVVLMAVLLGLIQLVKRLILALIGPRLRNGNGEAKGS